MTEIYHLLRYPVSNGRDMIKLSREILHAYSSMGLSIDDDEVEGILGIESETDTMDLKSAINDEEFTRVFSIYGDLFEDSRRKVLDKLETLRNER
jgi:hypothetical protein